MYVNPALLAQVSNREDFLLTLSINDDDTGDAISMTGITLANPGAAFTAAAWTVTDGAIATTSATSITIPTFPVGNQLSALALTVGVGLAILPGDFVTIADTATGTNKMVGYVTSYLPATGALVAQIGWTFQFEIRRTPPRAPWADYTDYYDWGGGTVPVPPRLSAALGTGILHTDIGFLQILIPETTFRTLASGTYAACLTGTDSQSTRQLFIGRLPVFPGGVTQ